MDGAITEITSSQARILVDIGSDLDEIIRLPEIEGLTNGNPRYDAVFITHYHGDHYARANECMNTIPVYMSNVAKQIIESVFCLSNTRGKFTRPITNIESGKTVQIKDIRNNCNRGGPFSIPEHSLI